MVFWALVDRKSLFHPLTVQMSGVYALQCVENSQEVFETTQIGQVPGIPLITTRYSAIRHYAGFPGPDP